MKILHIRFCNLNSLAGEWHIDLTHPAFVSDGIFAIAGPTGAGKTTLLDAVCLALYGRTPRLSKVTKSGNEIMSRQTGECFAEVTFETQAGRFRCHWSQRRARKRPDGELQHPRHEIANADTGEIVEAKIKGVADRIEAATGMDFDRFTRSMLLAQGGFAAFLQAAPDERAPILEQITGTEIYSQISIRVHERLRQEREKLHALQAEAAGIAILAPEEEKELRQALEAGQKEETALSAKAADTAGAIAWLTALDGLRQEIAALDKEQARLRAEGEAFAPDGDKLKRAQEAALLDGDYATLAATRKQQAKDRAALEAAQKALPGLEAEAAKQAALLQAAEGQAARAREDAQAAEPLLHKVRALDQRLAEQQKTLAQDEERCQKDAAQIAADSQARQAGRARAAEAAQALERVAAYLAEHARDAWLVSGLTGVEEQLGGLLLGREAILRKEADLAGAEAAVEQAAKDLAEARQQSAARKEALHAAASSLGQGRQDLERLLEARLLREYRAEKETLLRELAFKARIAELEAHRAALEDGKPCPLCGALAHPFAAGNVPLPDADEQRIAALEALIGRAEALEAAVKQREEAEHAARLRLTEAEKQEATAAQTAATAGEGLAALRQGLERQRADFAGLKDSIAAKLRPLGIAAIADADIAPLLDSLRARLKAWQAEVENRALIEKQLAAMNSELQRLDAVLEARGQELAEKQTRLQALQQAVAAARDERRAIFGDKEPEREEQRLKQALAAAEAAAKKAGQVHAELRQQWQTGQSQAASLRTRISTRQPELDALQAAFAKSCEAAGFSGEAAFLQAVLPLERRKELAARQEQLKAAQTDLGARLKDRQDRLITEASRKVTDKPLDALQAEAQERENSLRSLREKLAALKHRLGENAAAKERLQTRQSLVEARIKECRRWENLHELIGSADGKKYRNFAQGLTFEMMVGHANRQLQKMTDRYLLVRDEALPLELNVVDNYQAGEIRSTKNLSGGESFIVSLALALGLSHMASRNVRVDSLFLDEGFGTLDDESLDIALETLSGLRQEGKLIGVISHIPAIRERIGTQILISPQSGGRSVISGPGCDGPARAATAVEN